MNKDNDHEGDLTMSPMRMACLQLHEMYIELQRAGFNKREALKMVTAVLLTGTEPDSE